MSVTILVNGHPVEIDDATWAVANPPSLPAIPRTISDRQFFQQLANDGKISEDEALAAVTIGTMPAAMATLVGQLPTEQQFPTKMLLMGATVFDRGNPLVGVLGQMYGMSDADLDALWTTASTL